MQFYNGYMTNRDHPAATFTGLRMYWSAVRSGPRLLIAQVPFQSSIRHMLFFTFVGYTGRKTILL